MTGFIGCSFLELPPLLLQTPQDPISGGTTVVLPGNGWALLFWQRGQDLPVLLVYFCDLPRGGLLPPCPQPLRYELDYSCHDVLPFWLMVKVAEGASNALAPAMPVLFSRQVQPAYICLPSKNWCSRKDSHPHLRC